MTKAANLAALAQGPAFSAYQSSGQSVSVGTWTKVQFQTEEFDTNSNFDNATNYRFTPTVAGYYQVNAAVYLASASATITVAVYKNGSEFKRSSQAFSSSLAHEVTALVYLNGSTDYIESYVYLSNTTSPVLAGLATHTYFQAFLARAA